MSSYPYTVALRSLNVSALRWDCRREHLLHEIHTYSASTLYLDFAEWNVKVKAKFNNITGCWEYIVRKLDTSYPFSSHLRVLLHPHSTFLHEFMVTITHLAGLASEPVVSYAQSSMYKDEVKINSLKGMDAVIDDNGNILSVSIVDNPASGYLTPDKGHV